MNAPILVSIRAQGNRKSEPTGRTEPEICLAKMSKKTRTTITTIESHECWVIKTRPPASPEVFCRSCLSGSAMLTPQSAAEQAGVSQRTVFRWIDEGVIHFAETKDGGLFVCLEPLFA